MINTPDAKRTGVPEHLPARLTITMWDYSWYSRAGDVFTDLAVSILQAKQRGYNTIRICAMPLLLFGHHDLAYRERLVVTGMGAAYGSGSRWYDGATRADFAPLERLGQLFDLAAEHDMFVILSSWEYQQSAAFAETSEWFEMLESVPEIDRFAALAEAFDLLLAWLRASRRLDRVAYVELHNEIEYSRFGPPHENPEFADLHTELTELAVCRIQGAHPDVLVTVCYARPQVFRLDELPPSLQVAHVHTYVYGVLGAMDAAIGLDFTGKHPPVGFPNAALKAMLTLDATTVEQHQPDGHWRIDAGVLSPHRAYVFDFVDPDKYDSWLYAHHLEWRQEMLTRLAFWIRLTGRWAQQRGIPAVLGEGYVGYTPLRSGFEDGPAGKEIAEFAIREAVEADYWGIILSSNASPVHPLWADIAWQRRWNDAVLAPRSP